MKRTLMYTVFVKIDDNDKPCNTQDIAEGIQRGIDIGMQEGFITGPDNEDVLVSKITTRYNENTGESIPGFDLLNDGKNPGSYTADASRSGDRDIYNEVRIGIYKDNGQECVADMLVGLDSTNMEPRVLVTTGGNGDGEHTFAIYPLRTPDESVKRIDGQL